MPPPPPPGRNPPRKEPTDADAYDTEPAVEESSAGGSPVATDSVCERITLKEGPGVSSKATASSSKACNVDENELLSETEKELVVARRRALAQGALSGLAA